MNLLLVDNDTDTRQELIDLCVRCGYNVTTVHCLDITPQMAKEYDVIVLSGGYWYDDAENHMSTYKSELELIRSSDVPIIGICLGMQLMHVAYDGDVPLLDQAQNGVQSISVTPTGQQLLNLPPTMEVHKNHTRGVKVVGTAFNVLANSPGHIEIMMHKERPLLGVQFHPEVGDTMRNMALFKTLLASVGVAVPNGMQLPLRITPAQSILDGAWYDELVAVAGVSTEIYTLLGPSAQTLETMKSAFFASNKQINPNLQPAEFDETALEQTKSRLEQLQIRVSHEVNPHVRNAYERCITECIQKIDMFFAASHGDNATFETLNTIVYGSPDPSIFSAAVAHFAALASVQAVKGNKAARIAARSVLDVLPPVSAEPTAISPSPSVFADMKHRHEAAGGFYNELFKGTPLESNGMVKTKAGDTLLRRLLKNVGADSYGIMDSSDGFWAVHYTPPCIVRPAVYELPKEYFVGTVGHEIGSHLLERLNGADQSLRLLGFGLQGYESGNEGRAVMREQVVYASWQDWSTKPRWRDILLRHLSISLALGIDRAGQPRTFAETFAIVHALDLLWELAYGDSKNAAQRTEDHTWNVLVRALKGTDGKGGAYHKDIVYLEGNAACWELAATKPALIMSGDRGKFSVINKDHLTLLQNLGINLESPK